MHHEEPVTDHRMRRRRVAAAKRALRDLRIELSVLNHRVGANIALRDVDLDCLDVVARYGPLSPSVLARRVGVHLATMTGVLDRLEAGGWITRERAAGDRRGVVVQGVPGRLRDLVRAYAGMNEAMDEICADYSDEELEVIIDFLTRTADAGRSSTEELP